MNVRLWGMVFFIVVFLLYAGWADWSMLMKKPGIVSTALSTARTANSEVLQPCEDGQESYFGPLVPTQVTHQPLSDLDKKELQDPVPQYDWSDKAGFSVSYATDPTYWAQLLGSGWYLDWRMSEGTLSTAPEHWQMVRVHEDCISPSPQAIQIAAFTNPGQVWIIGNEPDVIWQDNVTPERYALSYHELYWLIKSSDSSALVAVGGIAQATPLRLQYLDRVLQTYQELYQETLPADWWTIHGYVLREEKDSWGVEIPPGIDATQGKLYEVSDHYRIDYFEEQIVSFRQWMKENGYQDKPLALTEFGILMPTSYGFPFESIANYLEETFTWLYQAMDESIGFPGDEYHLVQRWAWFSISDPNYPSSNLGEISTGKLTLVGERFHSVVSTKGR